jgi:hypothetical protein
MRAKKTNTKGLALPPRWEALDRELREHFETALAERHRIEGPLNGYGRGYEIAGKLKSLLPAWFVAWLEDSNWCEVCINQGYDAFFLFVTEMGYNRERWWAWSSRFAA